MLQVSPPEYKPEPEPERSSAPELTMLLFGTELELERARES